MGNHRQKSKPGGDGDWKVYKGIWKSTADCNSTQWDTEMQETFSKCVIIIYIATCIAISCCSKSSVLPSSSRLCLPCTVLLRGERFKVWTCHPAHGPRVQSKAPHVSRGTPSHHSTSLCHWSRLHQSWRRGHLLAPRAILLAANCSLEQKGVLCK